MNTIPFSIHQNLPDPPSHLLQAGRELWRITLEQWDLSPTDLPLLAVACEQVDRIAECRRIIESDGLMLTDPSGRQRCHPLLAVEKEANNLLLRAWRQLDLSDDMPAKVGRPSTRG